MAEVFNFRAEITRDIKQFDAARSDRPEIMSELHMNSEPRLEEIYPVFKK